MACLTVRRTGRSNAHFVSRRCDCLQVVDKVVETCRDAVICWMSTVHQHCSLLQPWRADLTTILVRETLLKKIGWRALLQQGAKMLKAQYPKYTQAIDSLVKKYMLKSPMQGILVARAYKWLKYLEINKPTNSSWYPHLAVEVAHKVFRLKGNLSTFRKYLSDPHRRKKLQSISPMRLCL